VRFRWGFLDERIPAPWVHRDEPMLHDLKRSALAMTASAAAENCRSQS
jgi:hypothetical protein